MWRLRLQGQKYAFLLSTLEIMDTPSKAFFSTFTNSFWYAGGRRISSHGHKDIQMTEMFLYFYKTLWTPHQGKTGAATKSVRLKRRNCEVLMQYLSQALITRIFVRAVQ